MRSATRGLALALCCVSCAHLIPARHGSPVIAEVDSEAITAEDLERRLDAEAELKEEIAGLDEGYVYDTKRSLLERLIAERLVDRDARTRGATLADVQREIAAEVVVSDEEVDRSFRLARDYPVRDPRLQRRVQRLLAGSEQEGRERIRTFVREEKCRVELLQRAIPLRHAAQVVVYLEEPQTSAQAKQP